MRNRSLGSSLFALVEFILTGTPTSVPEPSAANLARRAQAASSHALRFSSTARRQRSLRVDRGASVRIGVCACMN
jgi:hypothetical protein